MELGFLQGLIDERDYLVIIVTIFGIVTLSLSKILDANNLNEKLEAHVLLTDYAIRTKVSKDFISGNISAAKYTMERQIDYYQNNKSLILLTITVKNLQGKLIDTYKEIILLRDEKN